MSALEAPACGLLIVAASLADSAIVGELFAGPPRLVLGHDELALTRPWEGRLFAAVAALATGDGASDASGPPLLGLAVPVVWLSPGPAPEVVLVGDHVNLRMRGPLTGRSPVSGPQPFPSMSGQYQPALLRPGVASRVYSETAVAGVADAAAPSVFERREAARAGCLAISDCLVDATIVAALHGLRVAACGIPVATD